MRKYYGVDFEEQKKKIKSCNLASELTEEVFEIANEAIKKEYEIFKFSKYMLYYETGDRFAFESGLREKRIDATAMAAALWLSDDEKYIKPLTDLIFAICDEFTWCVPAHARLDELNPGIEEIIGEIDLYNTRTVTCLTDILAIVGDKLSKYVKMRVEYEVRRRITEAFKRRTYRWENWDNNWIVTCLEGILFAFVNFGTKEEINEQLFRITSLLDKYIKGFGDDYCCIEGSGYWGVFIAFLRCAVILYDLTDGEIDYFKREDVKQIALFQQRVLLGKNLTVGFSDTNSQFSHHIACSCFLKRLYKEDFYLPKLELKRTFKNAMGVGLVGLFWFDCDYKEDDLKYETTYFKNAEWFVSRRKDYSFAAKGGHNEETHNHNDVGSFIITKGDDVILEDLGAGLYTKQAFTLETRYNYLNWASWGHSLPMINGTPQCVGKNYRAKDTKAQDNFFETDISGAYPEGMIGKLVRRFDLEENAVVLKDTYEFSDKTEFITERFVTKKKPELCDGYIAVGDSKLWYDNVKFSVDFKNDSYKNHQNTADVSVYFIDFEAKNKKETEFKIKIEV